MRAVLMCTQCGAANDYDLTPLYRNVADHERHMQYDLMRLSSAMRDLLYGNDNPEHALALTETAYKLYGEHWAKRADLMQFQF